MAATGFKKFMFALSCMSKYFMLSLVLYQSSWFTWQPCWSCCVGHVGQADRPAHKAAASWAAAQCQEPWVTYRTLPVMSVMSVIV